MRPILFSIGPISISSFGFFAALAFLFLSFLLWKFSQEELLYGKSPIAEETIFDALFVFVLGTLVGARLIFVFSHFDQFGYDLLKWLLVREISGFSFLGGFMMGALSLLVFSLKKKLNVSAVFDLFSFGVTAVLPLVFLGAFLDGVGAGAKTTLPWGVIFVGQEGRRHPVQLLAACLFLFLFLVLKRVRFISLKKKLAAGVVTLGFLSLSGLALFLLAFLGEGALYLNYFKQDQLWYLGTALVGGFGFYQRLGQSLKEDIAVFIIRAKSRIQR